MLNNIASTQIENIVINDSDRKKINLISNKSFRYFNIVIDYFSTQQIEVRLVAIKSIVQHFT